MTVAFVVYTVGYVVGVIVAWHARGRLADTEACLLAAGLSAAIDRHLEAERRAAIAELRLCECELLLIEHGLGVP